MKAGLCGFGLARMRNITGSCPKTGNDIEIGVLIMTNKQGMVGLLLIWFLSGMAPDLAAQTCNSAIRATTPDGDFTDNGDGTVTHAKTGLMWAKCSEGQSGASCASGTTSALTWAAALNAAKNSRLAGYSDWRLPSKKELTSLVETRCYDPSINLTRFPSTPSTWFWTSSSGADVSGYAWRVAFGYGSVGYGYRSDGDGVRLVRGGQAFDFLASTPTVVNGSCGGANGQTLSGTPTSGLCSTGSASSVSGSGPWYWSCSGSNGGSTASCSANKQPTNPPINGTCGGANGQTLGSTPASAGDLCYVGNASAVSGSGPWYWSCSGSNGGSTASCSANKQPPNPPVNGTCGGANGQTLGNAPASDLCYVGTASAVSGSGPWYWSCSGSNGGSTASCSANLQPATPINGSCGGANGQTLDNAPSSGLCSLGTASSVSGFGPWYWSCSGSNGGSTASCSASLIPSGGGGGGQDPGYGDGGVTPGNGGGDSGTGATTPDDGGSHPSLVRNGHNNGALSPEAQQTVESAVLGGYSIIDGISRFALARYTDKGVLDTSFGKEGTGKVVTPVGVSSDKGYTITTQEDGMILLGGSSFSGGAENFALVRYKADGTPDPFFGKNGDGVVTIKLGGDINRGQSLAVQSDKKILMGGYTAGGSRGDGFALVRFRPNGDPDNEFGDNGDGIVVTKVGYSDRGQSLAIQPKDKKILLGGYTYDSASKKQVFALMRYDTNGTPDPSFGVDHKGIAITSVDGSSGDKGYSLFVLPNDKILLGGRTTKDTNQHFAVACYTSEGIPDTNFGNGTGKAITPAGSGDDAGGRSLAVDSAGRILLGGTKGNKDTEYQFAVARFASNGALDTQFGSNGLASTPMKDGNTYIGMSLKLQQSDGKILVGGTRKTSDGKSQFAMARFLPGYSENANVVTLITLYYQTILGRAPESDGLAYYQDKIAKAQALGDVKPAFRQMGYDFFNSPEYLNRKTSSADYITNLYKTFLQRNPDASGLQYYLDRLSKGESRNTFITDFTNSPEFANFMKSLGF